MNQSTHVDDGASLMDRAPGPVGTRAPTGEPRTTAALERHAPLIAGVALSLPTLIAYYLPMSDLPMHEGVVGVLRHFNDPAYFPEGLYDLNLGHPNQLFHVASVLLSFAVGTRWAVKIVIALTQIGIMLAGARLADHLGRSRWGVMLLAPLAIGFTYYWGLVTNLVGFCALLAMLPTLDRAVTTPNRRNLLKACGAMVLLFFSHESSFMMGAFVVGLLTLAYPLEVRNTVKRLLPALFATVIALVHLKWQQSKFAAAAIIVPPAWFTLIDKFKYLPNVVFGAHEWEMQGLLLLLGVMGIVSLAVARIRGDHTPRLEGGRLECARAGLHRYRFELIAAAYALLYFTMPFAWNGATLLHERFFGPAWAILAICAAPRTAAPRLAKFAGSMLPVAVLLTAWPQFADASTTFRSLDRVTESLPKGKSATHVVVDRARPFSRVYSAGPAPGRILATHGGRIGFGLFISPISPVQIRPEFRRDEFERRFLLFGSRTFIPAHDFHNWEYVIAGSRDESVRRHLIEAFAPEAELVSADGEWMLFKAKQPPVPLKSPEGPWPPQGSETIMARALKLEAAAIAAQAARTGQPPTLAPSAAPPPSPTAAPTH